MQRISQGTATTVWLIPFCLGEIRDTQSQLKDVNKLLKLWQKEISAKAGMIRSKRETAETERALEKQAEMFIEGYQAVLVKDMSYKGLLEGVVYVARILRKIQGDFLRDMPYNGKA